MKTLLTALLVLTNIALFAQGDGEIQSSFPEFVPYIVQEKTENVNNLELIITELGKEQPARWLSIDPLSDEYPGWSPYNYTLNNPLLFVDPNGMWVDDYFIQQSGEIAVKENSNDYNNYFVEQDNGSYEMVAQLEKITNGNGEVMVKLPPVGQSFINNSTDANSYVNSVVAASLLGAASSYNSETGLKAQFTQLNNLNGGHSGHGGNGQYADVRYANTKGNINEAVYTNKNNFDKVNSQKLSNNFTKFGYNSPNGRSILTENSTGNGPALNNTRFVDGKGKFHHKHHMHLQKYNDNSFLSGGGR